jgi:hypothetical protein
MEQMTRNAAKARVLAGESSASSSTRDSKAKTERIDDNYDDNVLGIDDERMELDIMLARSRKLATKYVASFSTFPFSIAISLQPRIRNHARGLQSPF